MKVRMILWETGDYESTVPAPNASLAPVAFPMEVTYYGDDGDHPDKVMLQSEDELRQWATDAHGEGSFEIWDMEVPAGAIISDGNASIQTLLGALDHTITEVCEGLVPTAPLSDALDELWMRLRDHGMIPTKSQKGGGWAVYAIRDDGEEHWVNQCSTPHEAEEAADAYWRFTGVKHEVRFEDTEEDPFDKLPRDHPARLDMGGTGNPEDYPQEVE